MISLCFKSYNPVSFVKIEHLLSREQLQNIYYVQKKFNNSYNLIIHYKGTKKDIFYNHLSSILSSYFISTFEQNYIKKQINYDYFYFSDSEKKIIFENIFSFLKNKKKYKKIYKALKDAILNYIRLNKYCHLEGFYTFRLYSYKSLLDSVIEKTIQQYILEKEYSEYINLLSNYIQSQTPERDVIHLIYTENHKLLLDENSTVITNTSRSEIYLSDISFSSNDYLLNSLLALLPQKLCIHTNIEDNFIIFLKNIFKSRVYMCSTCHICKNYILCNAFI